MTMFCLTYNELQERWPVLNGVGFKEPALAGWNGVLASFMEQIADRYALLHLPLERGTFKLAGVKEKHNRLSIEVAMCLCEWFDIDTAAEQASGHTCQWCGFEGGSESVIDGRWFVACPDHAPQGGKSLWQWRIEQERSRQFEKPSI